MSLIQPFISYLSSTHYLSVTLLGDWDASVSKTGNVHDRIQHVMVGETYKPTNK